MSWTGRLVAIACCLALLIASAPAPSAQPDLTGRVVAVKLWLAKSTAQLRAYQWIETTVVSIKGEVKSTKVSHCFYDASGVLQKIEVSDSAPPGKKPAGRGATAKNKAKNLTEYIEKAQALVKSYIPPAREKLQAAKDDGKMSTEILPGERNVKMNFRDYQLPGDNLWVWAEQATSKPLGFGVATYIDIPKDAVGLNATIATLSDGTGYLDKITLDAKAKQVQVTVTNTGHKKTGD